jgi:hypothetical protein
MAQWELGNIDNFLSMFGRKRLRLVYQASGVA